MMLRESSQHSAEAVQLQDVTQGLSDKTAVKHAALLVAFAESITLREPERSALARQSLLDAIGAASFVDVCAIIAAFHGFTRIADAIGIPYTTAVMCRDDPAMREQAGINAFFRVREATR